MRRSGAGRKGSSRRFNKRVSKTNAMNLASPRRGGWRL